MTSGYDPSKPAWPPFYSAEPEATVNALWSLLKDRQMIDEAAFDGTMDMLANKLSPRNGMKVVAKAWTDPAFKTRLMADAKKAISDDFGYGGPEGDIVVVENTEHTHNLVVCTLCSCYPWPLLGLPPIWYKSLGYRSRAAFIPRVVLQQFGYRVPDTMEVRVWESNADLRYFVLPMRPKGTESWSADKLEQIVTRDSMVGTAPIVVPAQGAHP
jgi:nitrile hydratase subunit alpha